MTIDSSTPLQFDPTEADEFRWFTREEMQVMVVDDSTSKMTESFKRILKEHYL